MYQLTERIDNKMKLQKWRIGAVILLVLSFAALLLVWVYPVAGRTIQDVCEECRFRILPSDYFDTCRICEGPCVLPDGEMHHIFLTGETVDELIAEIREVWYWWCDSCLYTGAQMFLIDECDPN